MYLNQFYCNQHHRSRFLFDIQKNARFYCVAIRIWTFLRFHLFHSIEMEGEATNKQTTTPKSCTIWIHANLIIIILFPQELFC